MAHKYLGILMLLPLGVTVLLVFTSIIVGAEVDIPSAPTSPTFVLPKPDGPYSVGVRAFAWIDHSREESATPEPGDYRAVTVQVWYPANPKPDVPTAVYTPELEIILAAVSDVAKDSRKFINMHAPLRGVATNSVAGADMAEFPELRPVIRPA